MHIHEAIFGLSKRDLNYSQHAHKNALHARRFGFVGAKGELAGDLHSNFADEQVELADSWRQLADAWDCLADEQYQDLAGTWGVFGGVLQCCLAPVLRRGFGKH